MRKTLTSIIILVLLSPLFAGYIFTEYNAEPETNRVTISWLTKAENDVKQFVILRKKSSENIFREIKRINVQGPGTQYTYVDENVVFKDITPLFYKIRAVNGNNVMKEESDDMMVHPNVSSIFRTWGTIKAIFQ
ncbi:MAG: hypothetical protein JXR46_04705 [Calditrichaceae bacterium]|nr:hypothetical protein [Calditrichaceae bacterium]MBN2708328.1 hypothetical protein [Calditrichaceae bacterium]RQV95217.1 MAG: hypothetical protein EH224_08035 [Calditrichota bacterium]